jgi:hypothetical protein
LVQRIPEAKTAKNRLHLDLRSTDTRSAEVERLVGLGAAVVRAFDTHTVMKDPEDNEFCVEPGPGEAAR